MGGPANPTGGPPPPIGGPDKTEEDLGNGVVFISPSGTATP